MIVPMLWLTQYRVKGINSEWVKEELHSNRYRNIKYTEESKDIFLGVNIRGGIMYFLKDNMYNGACDIKNLNTDKETNRYLAPNNIDVFIQDDIAENIVIKTSSNNTFDRIVGSCNEFGIESNIITLGNEIRLYRSFGEVSSCGLDEVPKGKQYINLYKVIIGRTYGKGLKGERVPKPRIIGPNEIVTGSLLMIGKSENRGYCENVAKYMQTKIFSLLVSLRKSTHNATKEAYKFVPMQDFTENSDIDWNLSVSEIDKQLYKKYNLTQEEIDYIERTIKPMES